MKLCEVIRWKASHDELVFLEEKGSHELIIYYKTLQQNLTSLGARLKEVVATERRSKEALSVDEKSTKRKK